jgi:hypothetical protein
MRAARRQSRRILEEVMNRFALILALGGSIAAAAPLAAQGRGRDDGIPAGHRPPPGMCRIWIDGVPPGQQPAPTDCATAVRNRPANGRVIFGDDGGKRRGKRYQNDDRKDRDADDDRRDRRGRDEARDEYPSALPEMLGAMLIGRGQRTDDVSRWLGRDVSQARTVDRDRNGLPERVTWLDGAGRVLQVWVDSDRDGRADTVEVYREGRVVRRLARP